MATAPSEAKAEVKAEAKGKEVEENKAHLKCKTWVLKVSIHCEGCKRRVEKILTNIDGVYKTDIDLKQHKVTVTGDVDAGTLIRKLEKKGKHAELWPEIKAEQKEKKQTKAKNKEKQQLQSDQESCEEGNSPSAADKETVKVEVPNPEPASKSKENENGGTVHVKVNEGDGGATGKANGQVKESKPEVKQAVTSPAVGPPPVADKKVGGESEGVAEKSGDGGSSGSGGKKKKKKAHKGNNGNHNAATVDGEPSADAAPAGTGSPPIHGPFQGPMPTPASYSHPHQHGYHYPPPAHYNAPPVYAVSYNTAYPRTSYSTSYYAPPTPYSYAYMHPGTGTELPPSDIDSYSSQPSDSFEIFSDENPNACSIM